MGQDEMTKGTAVPDKLRWEPKIADGLIDRHQVESVAFTPMDARLRNELITDTYGDLAQAMADVVGTSDVTWTALGQWASHEVGGFMAVPIPGFQRIVVRALGDGNRDVFADIGRASVDFLETVGRAGDSPEDLAAAWDVCEQRLQQRRISPPGDPGGGRGGASEAWFSDPRNRPPGPLFNAPLVRGFQAYYRAISAEDPQRRSEHILLGNCLLALHEQRLLSMAITMAIRSPIRTLTTPWRSCFQTRRAWRLHDPGPTRLAFEHWCFHLITRCLIWVDLPLRAPADRIKVGRPMEAGTDPFVVEHPPIGAIFPKSIAEVENMSDRDLLSALFAHVGIDGAPARCWNDLNDRLANISALLAEHQRSNEWFDDAGQMIKAKHRRKFEARLNRVIQALDVHSTTGIISTGVDAGAIADPTAAGVAAEPDVWLAGLRDEGSNPPPLERGLPLCSIDIPERARAFQPVIDDLAERHRFITEPGRHLDAAMCGTAMEVVDESLTMAQLGLACRSLPADYASAVHAHVLGVVSDLSRDPFHRTEETARFVGDLLAGGPSRGPTTIEPDSPAYQAVLLLKKRRALIADHLLRERRARVAGHLLNREWPTEQLGVPFNQEDVLGSALALAVPPVEMADQMGIGPTPEARDAWARFWLGVGYLLGAPYDAITTPDGQPLGYEAARSLASIHQRRHRARSIDGVRLTETLIDGMADRLPRPLGWLAPILLRAFGDDEVNRLLLATLGPGRRRAAALRVLVRGLLGHRPTRKPTVALLDWLGQGLVRSIDAVAGAGSTRPGQATLVGGRRSGRERVPDVWPVNCGDEADEGQPTLSGIGRRQRRRPGQRDRQRRARRGHDHQAVRGPRRAGP